MKNRREYKITYNFSENKSNYKFENILSNLFKKYLINYETK